MSKRKAKWDIFISYASEDKHALVQPLADALTQFGLKVWYDLFELSPGDSLSRSIDKGLSQSKYGLVVLSPAFFAKGWPEYELRGLVAREIGASQVIIPIWHNVTRDTVLAYSPPLADKVALLSDKRSPLQLALRVIEKVRPDLMTRIHRRAASLRASAAAQQQRIDPKDIIVPPPRHETLPPELIRRIRLVRAALLSAYPLTMNAWVYGFRVDTHPSREISFWEHLAACYLEYLQASKRQRIYQETSVRWMRNRRISTRRSFQGIYQIS